MSNVKLKINAAFTRRTPGGKVHRQCVTGIMVEGYPWRYDNFPMIQDALNNHRPGKGWELAGYALIEAIYPAAPTHAR